MTSEWKCGRCGTIYDSEGFMALERTKAVSDDPDPMKNYGYVLVCGCGYRFHLDKWFMNSTGTILHHMTIFHNFFHAISFGRFCKPYEIKVNISTVDLELNHEYLGGESLYYETMIFPSRKGGVTECWYQNRYPRKELADTDHHRLRDLFKRGKYLITYSWSDYHQRFLWILDLSEGHNRIIPKVELQGEIVTERPDPTFAQQQTLAEAMTTEN